MCVLDPKTSFQIAAELLKHLLSTSTDTGPVYLCADGIREVGFSFILSSFVQWEARDCCRGNCGQPDVSTTRERRGLANDGLEPLRFVVMLFSPEDYTVISYDSILPWHPSVENLPSSPDPLTPALLPSFLFNSDSLR